MQIKKIAAHLIALGAMLSLNGCATVQVQDPADPWEGWNRSMQSFNDSVDDYVMKPVAEGYRWITPDFVDQGISNFFSNIGDIRVTINDALQGKFAQSAFDGTRFFLNSTLGLGGFIDLASNVNLPKHHEDFDQTLGFWGVPSGPYLVLPLLGPSSPRGVLGVAGDVAMNPISYTGVYFSSSAVSTAVSGGLGAVNAIDLRADNLENERIASEAALDRYAFFRGAYLSQRNYLIHDGNVPDEDVLNLDDQEGLSPVQPY
ncbi:MlaA family lipoprotein [Methylomonas methanica]|uniref:VacJ family lipoprotein n=1 Tax=Methylomonas methanica (strain DSM 25384 / MC09) TaxID=857087 RepID=G0A2T1_METMM|nr:VacJ family lipoprotein [Methylomonas methanica]AEG01434.1 VacJ family lipoprotein [Methylomonas methanica MC09]